MLLLSEQQLTLRMYTCRRSCCGEKKISFCVHFKTVINSQAFKTVKQNGWNL